MRGRDRERNREREREQEREWEQERSTEGGERAREREGERERLEGRYWRNLLVAVSRVEWTHADRHMLIAKDYWTCVLQTRTREGNNFHQRTVHQKIMLNEALLGWCPDRLVDDTITAGFIRRDIASICAAFNGKQGEKSNTTVLIQCYQAEDRQPLNEFLPRCHPSWVWSLLIQRATLLISVLISWHGGGGLDQKMPDLGLVCGIQVPYHRWEIMQLESEETRGGLGKQS